MAIPGEKNGVFSEYCTHAASMTFKFPDNVSTIEGGLMEPLAAVIHACGLSNAKPSETVVMLGAGCTGLVTLMSLKARGVSKICVTDVLGKRLEKTRKLGTVRMFNSGSKNIEEFMDLYPFYKDKMIKAAIKI